MSDRVSAKHLAPGPGGKHEPQRLYDWQLQLTVPGAGDIIWTVESAFLPTESNEVIELPYGNEVQFVAGKARVEPGNISIRDMCDVDMQKHVSEWRKKVHDFETGATGWATDYKTNGYLVLLDPTGSRKQRKWKITGLWPQSVNFSEAGLEYGNNDIVRIGVSIVFDRCKYEG